MSQEEAFAIAAEACRRLRLTPRETNLIWDCLYAWWQVRNGNLLIPPRRVPAARRLIERGYLAQSENQPAPFDPKGFGLVVVIQQAHLTKLIADANAALAGKECP